MTFDKTILAATDDADSRFLIFNPRYECENDGDGSVATLASCKWAEFRFDKEMQF